MTNVAIVGAGKGGLALLEMFRDDPTVTLLEMVDLNPWARPASSWRAGSISRWPPIRRRSSPMSTST
jgi:2-polyprenyl-6-methoxyphenol hydroxylase-like FAD-dependent oxidoreductase